MPDPLDAIDHVHVQVADRAGAEIWYAAILDLHRHPALGSWATATGPLMPSDASGSVMLALFAHPAPTPGSTIALRTGADRFLDWLTRLRDHLDPPPEPVDHRLSWSVYFTDPDGNPFEITCYDHQTLSAHLQPRETPCSSTA